MPLGEPPLPNGLCRCGCALPCNEACSRRGLTADLQRSGGCRLSLLPSGVMIGPLSWHRGTAPA